MFTSTSNQRAANSSIEAVRWVIFSILCSLVGAAIYIKKTWLSILAAVICILLAAKFEDQIRGPLCVLAAAALFCGFVSFILSVPTAKQMLSRAAALIPQLFFRCWDQFLQFLCRHLSLSEDKHVIEWLRRNTVSNPFTPVRVDFTPHWMTGTELRTEMDSFRKKMEEKIEEWEKAHVAAAV